MVRPELFGPPPAGPAAQHDVRQLEELERADGRRHQHEDSDGPDARQGDGPELLPLVRPVHGRRLVQARVHGLEGGQEVNHVEADIHPQRRQHQGRHDIARLRQPFKIVSRRKAGNQEVDNLVYQPELRDEQDGEQRTPTKTWPSRLGEKKASRRKVAPAQPGLVEQQRQPQGQRQAAGRRTRRHKRRCSRRRYGRIDRQTGIGSCSRRRRRCFSARWLHRTPVRGS